MIGCYQLSAFLFQVNYQGNLIGFLYSLDVRMRGNLTTTTALANSRLNQYLLYWFVSVFFHFLECYFISINFFRKLTKHQSLIINIINTTMSMSIVTFVLVSLAAHCYFAQGIKHLPTFSWDAKNPL